MTSAFQPRDRARFEAALQRFDAENAQDPKLVQTSTGTVPAELLYSQWLTDWVVRLCPDASEELRLAARCQHLCRWMIPRASYPMTRAGYLRWREDLKHFHARKAGELLTEVGYPPETVARVQALNLKRGFPQDPEARVLEDALCLVFLEHQFAELTEKTPEEKVIPALRKSWGKMTSKARDLALELPLTQAQKVLLNRALADK